MDAKLTYVDRDTWQTLSNEQRRRLRPTGLSVEDRLRLGQRLSAHAAAVRRSKSPHGAPVDLVAIRDIHGELPIDPIPGLDS